MARSVAVGHGFLGDGIRGAGRVVRRVAVEGETLNHMQPLTHGCDAQALRFGDDGIEFGELGEWSPVFRGGSDDVKGRPRLPQLRNKKKRIRQGGVDDQDVDRKLVSLQQFTRSRDVQGWHSTEPLGIQGLAEPEDEPQVGIDEQDRDAVPFRFPLSLRPAGLQ